MVYNLVFPLLMFCELSNSEKYVKYLKRFKYCYLTVLECTLENRKTFLTITVNNLK